MGSAQIGVNIYSSICHSIFYPGTRQNVDLSDNGNATPGTPVTLWSEWQGLNQVWRLEETN